MGHFKIADESIFLVQYNLCSIVWVIFRKDTGGGGQMPD